MEYVRVKNNQVTETLNYRPHWFNDDGLPVSDQWLIENESIYRAILNGPEGTPFKIKEKEDWLVTETHVEKTFWLIDENLPEYNPLIEKIETKEESEWVEDGEYLRKVHDVVPCSEEDAQRYVDKHGAVTPEIDRAKFLLKPLQEWSFHDNIITKTYWEIVDSPDKENYPGAFYKCLQNESQNWIKTQTTAQKTYTYIERPIQEIVTYLKKDLEVLRWYIETEGLLWDGKEIHTDRESQTKILTAFIAAKEGIRTNNVKWKTKQGFVMLTPTEMQAMSMHVFDTIEQLYETEDTIIQKINNVMGQGLSDTETFSALKSIHDGLLSEPWPQNSLYIIKKTSE